jgi:hypothetical protein
MELKIVVPTHIWEFEPIQKQWFESYLDTFGDWMGNISITTIHEQGEAPSGRNVRQKYTDLYANQNVYLHLLDCDNLIPFDVLDRLNFLFGTKEFKIPKIIMLAQKWHTQGIKRLNAAPENCVPARCDIAQLFVHGSFLKDMVWSGDYENDGQFIAELHKRYPNDFIFVNDVNVWYNALKPHSTLYNGQIITIA